MATSEDSERKGKAPVDHVAPPSEPMDLPPVDSEYEDPPPSEHRDSGMAMEMPPPAKPKDAAVVMSKDYIDPEPVPIWDPSEFQRWSLWRATIAEFMASFLFLNICVQAVVGNAAEGPCNGIGTLGIAFTFGITIYVLVYCIAGISGGHINPAITFAMFLVRRVSFPRALLYIIAQVLGGLAGVGLVKAYQKGYYQRYGGGANFVQFGYSKGAGLVAEIIGTFVLVYVVLSATDAKRKARDAYVPPLAPAAIGLAVFIVHMATIPITGTSINPARSFATAAYWDHHDHAWHDHWIFWIGPLIGSTVAVLYQQYIIRAIPFNQLYVAAMSRP